ncbi:hypothetical protein ATANTOWER_017698 [Ataeniobius toweri]|uniref:Uncharacterized protein n=1 Tax=Ataeniobius toweri TaxID=208326 RepID=A0ABU7APR2_9TELE|nr:hypothetical protein [Ataeniobius toweri]
MEEGQEQIKQKLSEISGSQFSGLTKKNVFTNKKKNTWRTTKANYNDRTEKERSINTQTVPPTETSDTSWICCAETATMAKHKEPDKNTPNLFSRLKNPVSIQTDVLQNDAWRAANVTEEDKEKRARFSLA